jgi:hypothetical protein
MNESPPAPMANAISRLHVQARWAYSELRSKNHGRFYDVPAFDELKGKLARKVPFETLGEKEIDLLDLGFRIVRGAYFERYLIGIAAFQLARWSKNQLGNVYVIAEYLPDGMRTATFKQSIEGRPRAVCGFDSPFVQDDPVTIGRNVAGTMFLIDGYHRADRFWSTDDSAATLDAFVPLDVTL